MTAAAQPRWLSGFQPQHGALLASRPSAGGRGGAAAWGRGERQLLRDRQLHCSWDVGCGTGQEGSCAVQGTALEVLCRPTKIIFC